MGVADAPGERAAVRHAASVEVARVLQRQIDEVAGRKHAKREEVRVGRETCVTSANKAVDFPLTDLIATNCFKIRRPGFGLVDGENRGEVRPGGWNSRVLV